MQQCAAVSSACSSPRVATQSSDQCSARRRRAFSMSAAALEELAEKAEALAGRVSSRANKASDEFEEDEEEDDASYFKMKQELLTTYCGMLSYYLCRKARGESVADHPVVRRLYELRLTFEKLRLLDAKLRHQLDKVLARADAADVAPVANLEAVETVADSGVYKAPRSTVAYQEKDEASSDDDDEDDEAPRAPVKERQERSTRARRAEIDHLMRERSDAPVEVGSGGHDEALGTGQRAARRERRRKEQREQEAYEEDAFRRVDTNKKKKKRRKTADFASSLDDLI